MTREELARALADLERHFAECVEIWRIVVNADGTPTGQRIFRGSFQQPRRETKHHDEPRT
jgi:hypothetical protein